MSLKIDQETVQLPASWKGKAPLLIVAAVILLAVGAGLCFVGGLPSGDDGKLSLKYLTHSYLANFMFLFSFSIGALFFVLIQFLTRAGWSTSIRRVAEIVMAVLPWSAILFLPILLLLFFGDSSLYDWNKPAAEIDNSLILAKKGYFATGFFTFRSLVYIGLLSLMAVWFFSKSRAQDETGDVELSLDRQKWSGPMLFAFSLVVSFIAFDWVMSIDADWYSTIFGVYFFSASMMATFALLVIINMLLQRSGKLKGLVNIEHYHDMGKFMFGFVMFWAYIAFSQLILIWYANIPEETVWYKVRLSDGWQYFSYGLIFIHFVLPFLGLMSRHVRRHKTALFFWACWLVFVHWVDMTYLIMPNVPGGLPIVPLLGHLLGGIGMFALLFAFFIVRASGVPLVATRDPRLPEALTYANPLL